MPAGYAHYVFGRKVLDALEPQYKELIKQHIHLYDIGIHGPDALFYYNALKSNPVIRLGQKTHKEEAYKFFTHAKEVIENTTNKDASIVYTYGFINHFVLDHVCHGYVYYMQEKLDMSHYGVESHFDRKMLVLEGKDPTSACLTSHVHTDDYICEVIAPFFNLNQKMIKKGLKDLIFYLNLLVAPTKLRRNIIHAVMKLAGIYESHSPLMISEFEDKKSREDINELVNRLENAIPLAKRLIEEFMDKDLDEIYHNDFEGVKVTK